jgi:hypothetical protein
MGRSNLSNKLEYESIERVAEFFTFLSIKSAISNTRANKQNRKTAVMKIALVPVFKTRMVKL